MTVCPFFMKISELFHRNENSQSQHCSAESCDFRGGDERAMDPSLQHFSLHKVNKKLKVRIGSIQEELKLVVKIDKGLVHLPGQVRTYRRCKKTKRKKVERKKDHSCDTSQTDRFKQPLRRLHQYDTYSLITKPVDSTLLVSLATYANLPVKRTAKAKLPVLQIRKPNRVPVLRVVRQEDQSSFGKGSIYNLFEKRETTDKGFKLERNTEVEQESLNIWQGGGRSEFNDYISLPGASVPKMECGISNSKLNKNQSFCAEIKDQCETQLRNEANSIRNNNEVKIRNDTFGIKSLPNGEELKLDSEKFKTSELHHPRENTPIPLENEGKEQLSQQVTLLCIGDRGLNDDHFDQTVPQSPHSVHNHCNGSSLTETGDSVAHDETQFTDQHSKTAQETKVPEKSQSLEETDHDKEREIMRDKQADEMPTLEPQEIHLDKGSYPPGKNGFVKDGTYTLEKEGNDNRDETRFLLSSERSIGEKVDEEIKALLTNDVATRGGDAPLSVDSSESSNIPLLEHVYQNSEAWASTSVVCDVEEAGKMQKEIELKPESGIHRKEGDHINENEIHAVAISCERSERQVNVKTEDEMSEIECENMEGMRQEKQGENKEDTILVSFKEETQVLNQDSGFNEESQRLDCQGVEYDNSKVVKNNGETLQSSREFPKDEKLTLIDNRHTSSTSNIPENSNENVQSDSFTGDDSINKSLDKFHPTDKVPVAQTVKESQSNLVSENTADYSHCPPETSEECQVGRKGLKQLQSLSQHEAEVTSEQEDIISPPAGSSSGNEKSSSSLLAENCASETRSQSVIVSNPISLSHHTNIHGNINSEQLESNPEVKREIESNSLERNEAGLDTAVSSDRLGHVPTGETHPVEENSPPLERTELFQALTPPPPSYKAKRSLTRQMSAPMSNKHPGETPQQDEETGIQITSVRTLAPLTYKEKPSPLSTAVENLKARQHAALLHKEEPVHTIINEKRTLNHNVILQGPPVASLQATEKGVTLPRSTKVPQMHSPHLVDLSKGGGLQHVVAMGNDDRERLVMMPKGTDLRNLSTFQGYPTMVPNKNQILSYPPASKEVERPPVPLSEYNPEEQQQHFLEIKRHLLNSNMAGRTKDMASVPRVVPMAVSGPNTRPVISVAPVTQKENMTVATDEGKGDSPLGKFSGAMMEHVRHWKEQNEKTNQPQAILSPVKVMQNSVPVDPSNQPILYSPVVPPAHLSPTTAMDQANNLTKEDKTVDTQAADANRGLLENLQAIHKMYFKTIQGGDKVVFPKMPSKKTVAAPPGPMPDMVQIVKPFMPPMPPHLIPRFPPNGQVPPELLHYQMSVVGRNFPAPPQMSPPGQDNFPPGLIPQVPVINSSERHQLKFHDMNARFPRPFPVVQMDQVKPTQAGKPEMVMIRSTYPSQFPLPPQAYIDVKQNSFPHVKQEIISPTSSQGMPILVSPSGTKFVPSIDMAGHHKEMSETAVKRKPDDGTPLDLSTGAAKVRRIQEDNDQATDQPIDLSTRTKTSVEKLHAEKVAPLVQEHLVRDGTQPPSVGMVSLQGLLPPQSVNTITKNGTPAKTLPEHLLLSQYHAQQFAPSSIPMTPSSIPQGMRLPMMNYANAQMVLPHMALSPNSQHSQPPQIDGNNHQLAQQLSSAGMLAQKRMPTPSQVEIMKLVTANTGQLLPHGMVPLNKSATVSPAGSFPANVLSYSLANNSIPQRETLVQQMSERHVEVPVKRKRGRPKGSGNKNRRAALIANQMLIQEPSEPMPASASSDIAECQFCDFKAASRGDVRQHVKVVHFAKFRRDSNKSLSGCEMLTPTSEYAASVGHPMDSMNVESNTGQWTTVSEQNVVRQDQNPSSQALQNDSSVSPFTPNSDSDGSALVIDVSTEAHGAICTKQEEDVQEVISQGEASQMISDSNQAVNLQSNQEATTHNDGDRQDKPPLKITLRRISSSSGTSGDKNPMMFSPLPQDKLPTEKKAKFVCQKCGASYNYVNGLREHESRHRVDLPFECSVCHLKYKTLGMLSRHQAQKNHLPVK